MALLRNPNLIWITQCQNLTNVNVPVEHRLFARTYQRAFFMPVLNT